jgi:hypothetical protein
MGQITTYGNPEKSEAQKRAEAERLREFGPKPTVSVAPPPTEDEIDLRQVDVDRLAELILEKAKGESTFLSGLKMMVAPVWKDQDRALEAGQICGRLGISNPYTTTVMQIGEGAGIPQDKLHLFDLLCEELKKRYRANGSISKEYFTGP